MIKGALGNGVRDATIVIIMIVVIVVIGVMTAADRAQKRQLLVLYC